MNNATKNEVTYITNSGRNVTLNRDILAKYIEPNRLTRKEPVLTPAVVRKIMATCFRYKLDPNLDIFFMTDKNGGVTSVVSTEIYLKQAAHHPKFLRVETGVVVADKNGDAMERESGYILPGERLYGAWAKVIEKDRNPVTGAPEYEEKAFKYVNFDEYNKDNSMWKSKPVTMIVKVAIGQALKTAYPEDFEGLYSMTDEEGEDNPANDDIVKAVTGDELNKEEDGEGIPEEETSANDNGASEENREELINGDEIVSKQERIDLFHLAWGKWREASGNEKIKELLKEHYGTSTSRNMTRRQLKEMTTYVLAAK